MMNDLAFVAALGSLTIKLVHADRRRLGNRRADDRGAELDGKRLQSLNPTSFTEPAACLGSSGHQLPSAGA